MEITVHTITEVSRELEIQATADDLRPHFDKAYKAYQPKVDIKGFRKGKAPLDLVKKLYGDLIEQDSLQDIATEFYKQAVKEKELKPIGDPALIDMDYKKGEGVRFKIQYDIRPKIELKDYKGIPVEKVVHTVDDAELEAEILRLRRMNATTEPTTRVMDSEFIVTADLQDVDEANVPIIGKRSENVRFYLADEQLEQPFKDALKAAEAGGDYRVKFEHQHDDHSHSVNAVVKAKKIERVALPELNDAFVEKITKDKVKSVEAFRKDLLEDLHTYWKSRSERQVLNAITGEIIRRNDFQVPESLVRSVLEGLLEEMKNEYPNKQLPADFDREKFSQENRAYAVFQSKWALLREEIIKAENIQVSDDDLVKLAEAESDKIKIDKERLIHYYKTSDQIRDRLVGDKLLKLLVDSAKITEVAEKQPVLQA